MKKILISGPVLSRSGYGEMARFAFHSLKHRNDVDLYLLPTTWGNTGWLFDDNEQRNQIESLVTKTNLYTQQSNGQPHFDVAIQISIPNEWKKLAPINIGYTAGIETNMISPAWLEPTQLMNKIIVISEHAKSSFLNTVFGNQQGQQFKVSVPIEVVHLPYKNVEKQPLDLELSCDFNFLAVCQWGPRKNLDQTILGFLEEFRNEQVGLVLKINTANDSIMDRTMTQKRLEGLLENFPNRKCKVTLLHGHLTEGQVEALYVHPKIKAIVSTTHGEGYGLPLMEAAANELPVIATDWSGHTDFLYIDGKRMFGKIDYELKPIAKEHVWKGVLEEGTSWAYPVMSSYKDKMREVYKDYGRFKLQAKKLAPHVKQMMNEQNLKDDFFYSLGVFSKEIKIDVEKIDGVSFCIPTNGKRKEKTDLLIKSIKRQKWDDTPYEIILCGDVSQFDQKELILVDKKESAHRRKVADLRNSAAQVAKYNTIAFCDDDICLDKNFISEIKKYNENTGWKILGTKILNPDGTRHWDRSTINPRVLVDYSHPSNDKNLMQTSGFFLVRKEVFNSVKWDITKLVYADRQGEGIPEDVQFNLDLHKKDIPISFNKEAIVWHNDDSYTEFNGQTLKKETIKNLTGISYFPDKVDDFNNLLKCYE